MSLFPPINWKAHEEDLPPSNVSPKELRVVIVGCVRDCGKHLNESALRKLMKIERLFKECAFIYIQNDSKDNSPQVLNAWKSEFDRFDVFHYDKMDANLPERTQRLAFCRNTLVQKAFELYPDYDYLLMMDMDDVFDGRDVSSFVSPFKYDLNSWDAMATAFSSENYYDTWCLRVEGEIEFDCWEYIHVKKITEYWRVCREFQKPIPMTLEKPLRVLSAYAGAIYYKLKSIQGCTFVGTSSTSALKVICELVPFNEDLRKKGGKIYIDPKFRIKA